MIIFDVGSVLCHVYMNHFINAYWAHIYPNNDRYEPVEFLRRTEPFRELGMRTMKEELSEMVNKYRIFDRGAAEEAARAWYECIFQCDETVAIKDYVIEQGHDVAILSNMGPEHHRRIKDDFPQIFEGCSYIHLSYQVGAMKPSKLFYQSFQMARPDFNGSLYIDDLDANLEVAESLGYKTYKFDLKGIDYLNKFEREKEFMDLKTAITQFIYLNRDRVSNRKGIKL